MPVPSTQQPFDPHAQEAFNRSVYFSAGVQDHYLSEQLTPQEVACLLKYQPYFVGGDVLDIGVGAGRTARYLAPLARRYEGIDYSPVMVSHMRESMPSIQVNQGDLRQLTAFDGNAFDFVFATDNVIDAMSHEDRLRGLVEAHRVLRPGKILAFSSHNLNYEKAAQGPRLEWRRNPVTLAANAFRYLRRVKNHRRVGKHRVTTVEYALIDDIGHDFACLHYYASRSAVQAQIEGAGFRMLDAFDCHGRVLGDGEDDRSSPSLFYVAQRQN